MSLKIEIPKEYIIRIPQEPTNAKNPKEERAPRSQPQEPNHPQNETGTAALQEEAAASLWTLPRIAHKTSEDTIRPHERNSQLKQKERREPPEEPTRREEKPGRSESMEIPEEMTPPTHRAHPPKSNENQWTLPLWRPIPTKREDRKELTKETTPNPWRASVPTRNVDCELPTEIQTPQETYQQSPENMAPLEKEEHPETMDRQNKRERTERVEVTVLKKRIDDEEGTTLIRREKLTDQEERSVHAFTPRPVTLTNTARRLSPLLEVDNEEEYEQYTKSQFNQPRPRKIGPRIEEEEYPGMQELFLEPPRSKPPPMKEKRTALGTSLNAQRPGHQQHMAPIPILSMGQAPQYLYGKSPPPPRNKSPAKEEFPRAPQNFEFPPKREEERATREINPPPIPSPSKRVIPPKPQSYEFTLMGGGETYRETPSPLNEPWETVAGIHNDNRQYLTVDLAGERYRALVDPGATISLVGERITERFKERLTPSITSISTPLGDESKPRGDLKLSLDVGGITGMHTFVAMPTLSQEMILGMDFCIRWQIELTFSPKGMWRSKGGPWNEFSTNGEQGEVVAECAGLAEVKLDQQKVIEELLSKYLPNKDNPNAPLGTTNLVQHHIDVQGAPPIKERLRRLSPKMLEIARGEVAKMYSEDVIEPSASQWSSAPVIVKKEDGSYRFCVDYRPVNKVTRKDAYPIPRVDDTLDKLRKARFISKIDLKSAYYQILMEQDSKQYTAFAVPGSGLWQFKRMPFGLTNAPMTFQRLIDALFGPEFEPYVFGYLDDIIIVTETFEEHIHWLEIVLQKLQAAGLSINRDKCEFCCSSVTYLGFILDKEGLRPDPQKVAPVIQYPAPQNIRQLRRFLGMLGWYSRFIDKDSEIKVPLLKLLKKSEPWHWDEEEQEAFEKLKYALTIAPVLARPDFSREFTVQCDASNNAIGAVLTQEFEDGEHPIVYISRVLSTSERNYNVTQKECLALYWAVQKLRPYLEGYHFKVITDHSALKWLKTMKDPSGQLARWALELQEWDMEIVHRKGTQHELPDALSRMYEGQEEVAAFDEIRDPWYERRREGVKTTPEKFSSWKVEEELLYKHRKDPLLDPITTPQEGWRLVVPANHRAPLLEQAHCAPCSGHLGIAKTYDRIAREYYWPKLYHDVYHYVSSCPECQAYKTSQLGPQGLMGKRIVEHPWAVVAADVMEFPASKSQHKYVVVFMDLFTRWIELKPLRRADGKSVVRAFEELILFRWETPRFFLTDNGKEFANKFLIKTLNEYGITHTTTPPYHPQANPVERVNRTLKTMIATYVGNNHRDWDLYLPEFRHAVNTATHATTKISPAFLNFGREPTPVKSLRRQVETPRPITPIDPEVWKDRLKRLDALREVVAQVIDEEREKQAANYNKGKKFATFNIGDLVYCRDHPLSKGADRFSAKLAKKYRGPVRVLEILSPTVYIVETENAKQSGKVHVSQLKRLIPRLQSLEEESVNPREG